MGYYPQGTYCLYSKAPNTSHTGDTNPTTLDTYVLKANTLGLNDVLEVFTLWEYTNSVNNKTMSVTFGGTALQAVVATTTQSLFRMLTIQNRNALNSQISMNAGVAAGTTNVAGAVATSAIDTTADVTILAQCTLANTGETITLKAWNIIINKIQ